MRIFAALVGVALSAPVCIGCGNASHEAGSSAPATGSACSTVRCADGFHCVETGPSSGACLANDASGQCHSTADCTAYENYCTGCTCVVGPSKFPPVPACSQAMIGECLVNPCSFSVAQCVEGACSLQEKAKDP